MVGLKKERKLVSNQSHTTTTQQATESLGKGPYYCVCKSHNNSTASNREPGKESLLLCVSLALVERMSGVLGVRYIWSILYQAVKWNSQYCQACWSGTDKRSYGPYEQYYLYIPRWISFRFLVWNRCIWRFLGNLIWVDGWVMVGWYSSHIIDHCKSSWCLSYKHSNIVYW